MYSNLCNDDNYIIDDKIKGQIELDNSDYKFNQFETYGMYKKKDDYFNVSHIVNNERNDNILKLIKNKIGDDSDNIKKYFNEWLINEDAWKIKNDMVIVKKFLDTYKKFTLEKELLTNKQKLYKKCNNHMNSNDYIISKNSILYENDIYELKSLKPKKTIFNDEYFSGKHFKFYDKYKNN